MMAALAVHDKKADDAAFEQFYPVMKKFATDDRNFVRKAVNWALRNIGKRNLTLNRSAIEYGPGDTEDRQQGGPLDRCRRVAGAAGRKGPEAADRKRLEGKKAVNVADVQCPEN